MIILKILLGIALLTAGYDLFWLFVAGIGFILGLDIIAPFLPGLPAWMILVIAAGGGALGALLTVLCQRFAIVLAGILAGGYSCLYLSQELVSKSNQLSWLVFIAGGIVGGVLARFIFNWALIILSSLTGATLIIHALPLELSAKTLLFSVLVVMGTVIQAGHMLQKSDHPDRKTS
ncbi:DUF4203 domain-containing protein [candidate division CSSED10-310 bacterium]|uniref:DUF4203 domain-containing protein n=1 Tax=candidate division CSSED10-310 bacterium TaxID=2855610 RepID=A0ABV6YX12_UNCC1